MIMFKKLIAEIYLIKHDFDASKMYIEKALLMARKFGLDYFVMTLYHLYGKYFEEIITSKTTNDVQIVQNSFKMFDKSNDIAKFNDYEFLLFDKVICFDSFNQKIYIIVNIKLMI